MPHLISILQAKRSSNREQTSSSPPAKGSTEQDSEARKKELESLLRRGGGSGAGGGEKGGSGMEWGTCMVFSCSRDCRVDPEKKDEELKEVWAEELVLVQWDE